MAAAALILFIRSRSASKRNGDSIASGPGVPEGLMDGVWVSAEVTDTECASGPADCPLLMLSDAVGTSVSSGTGLLLLRPTPAHCIMFYLNPAMFQGQTADMTKIPNWIQKLDAAGRVTCSATGLATTQPLCSRHCSCVHQQAIKTSTAHVAPVATYLHYWPCACLLCSDLSECNAGTDCWSWLGAD